MLVSFGKAIVEERLNTVDVLRQTEAICDILNIANITSLDNKINACVKLLMVKYQTFLKAFAFNLFRFRDDCRDALERHTIAKQYYSAGEIQDALIETVKCKVKLKKWRITIDLRNLSNEVN